MLLPSLMYGQAVHPAPHFFIPLSFLLLWWACCFETFALIIYCLRFCCLLKATKGGFLKTSAKYLSFEVIDLQCLGWRLPMGGRRGSNVRANTGPLDFFLLTFLRAFCLGIDLALSIEKSIDFSLYPLSSKNSFNSAKRFSLSSEFVQILTILRLNGFLHHCLSNPFSNPVIQKCLPILWTIGYSQPKQLVHWTT